MKIIFFTLLNLLLLINTAYSQKNSDKPFKGATKVIITNSLSMAENLKQAGQAMIDLNYFISSKDNEYFTLKSDLIFVSAPGTNFSQIIYVKVKESNIEFISKVKFKGAFSQGNGVDAFELLTWKNDDPEDYAFKNILRLIDKIPHSTLIYSE